MWDNVIQDWNDIKYKIGEDNINDAPRDNHVD